MPESVGRVTGTAVTRPVVLLGVDLVAPGDPLAEQTEVVVRAGRVHREQPGADVEQLLADLLRLLVTDGDRTLDLARVAADRLAVLVQHGVLVRDRLGVAEAVPDVRVLRD